MSIKSILCVINGKPDEISPLNTALCLAKSQAAHVRILHITPSITASMEGMMNDGAMLQDVKADNAERLKRAKEYSIHYAALNRVPLDISGGQQHHASATFIHITGVTEDILSKEGRMCDLLIIGRNDEEAGVAHDPAVMTALFNTGRPVLVSPHLQGPLPSEWELKNITVGWNNTLESARALYHAMPFLEKAERVNVLIARDNAARSLVTDETGIMQYLQAHGITPEITIIGRDERTAGEALLAKTHELESDLMVMGAYSHMRFREMIFGGVTNYMLQKADIPLLLAH